MVRTFFLLTLLPAYVQAQPYAKKELVTDTYFGTTVEDPYQYLENLEDADVQDWFKLQSEYTESILSKLAGRQQLVELQHQLDAQNQTPISLLNRTQNGRLFYLKDGKVYFKAKEEADEELLYDPLSFKGDKSYVINYLKPDWDGEKLLISLTKNGQEISEMIIFDMISRKPVPDVVIGHSWPSDGGGVSWFPDNSGFIYLHYPVTDPADSGFLKNMKAVLYRIGEDPKQLNELFSKSNNPALGIQAHDFPMVITQNRHDRYAIGGVYGGTPYGDTYYASIQEVTKGNPEWKPLYGKEEKVAYYELDKESLYYLTAKNSPHYQLCSTSLQQPDFARPEVIVDAFPDEVITNFALTDEGIFFTTQRNGVQAKLYQLKKDGPEEIKLPAAFGNIALSSFQRQSPLLFLETNGWTRPTTHYTYNTAEGTFAIQSTGQQDVPSMLQDIVAEEVVVRSHDGEKVPLSLIYKKGLKWNGSTPALIFGYGAYGFSATPFHFTPFMLWISQGGMVAVAHVRGGGEKGDAWHEGGLKQTKPNTWKDAIACAEYLVEHNYSSPSHMALYGSSAAGILIGRAMTERPDLFGAAIPEVALLNPLRSYKEANGANGAKEFGDINVEEEFHALLEMDAYHHIKEGVSYPATLATTGMNDPRVTPWQPGKFIARLQHANRSGKPVLLKVNFQGGHNLDVNREQQIEHLADMLAFGFWQTGHPDYQPAE